MLFEDISHGNENVGFCGTIGAGWQLIGCSYGWAVIKA
jgi:hypothetical protein